MNYLLILALLFLSNLAFGQTQAVVLADTLKVYERPTTESPVICTRGKGATVTVVSTDPITHFSYIKSCLDGRNGYAPSYQLSDREPRPAPAPNFAYVCNGRYAKKYHSRLTCRGLNNCKATVSKVSLSSAQMSYDACIICFR